jgi:hypothetical protein
MPIGLGWEPGRVAVHESVAERVAGSVRGQLLCDHFTISQTYSNQIQPTADTMQEGLTNGLVWEPCQRLFHPHLLLPCCCTDTASS